MEIRSQNSDYQHGKGHREPFGVLEMFCALNCIAATQVHPICKNSLSGTVQICAIYPLHYVHFKLEEPKNKLEISLLPKTKTSSQSAACGKGKSVSPFAQVSFYLQPSLPRPPFPLLCGRAEHAHPPWRNSLLPAMHKTDLEK